MGTVQDHTSASEHVEHLSDQSDAQRAQRPDGTPSQGAPQASSAQDPIPGQGTPDDVSEYHSVLDPSEAETANDAPKASTSQRPEDHGSDGCHDPQLLLTAAQQDSQYPPGIVESPSSDAHHADWPALRVRRHVFRRVLSGLGRLGGIQRLGFWFKTVLVFGQLVAFIVILGLTHADLCDQPLRVFLSLHTARVGINYPLYIYTRLAPKPRRNATAEERQELERDRSVGNAALDRRVRLMVNLSTYSALVIFIFGNWIWYTSGSCSRTSPPLFWTAFAALWVGYLYIIQVIAIAVLVVFALPLVMLWANVFGITKKHEIKSLDKKEVEKLPLVLFIPQDTEASQDSGMQPMSRTSSRSTHRQARKRTKLERLFSRARPAAQSSADVKTAGAGGEADRHGYLKGPYPFHPLPENLAACPICLCDFEAPPLKTEVEDLRQVEWEPLRLLPCGHVLHKECLDPWLTGSSGRCPVCQAPVKKAPPSANPTQANEALPTTPAQAEHVV